MKKNLCAVVMLAGLSLSGCGQGDKEAPQPVAPPAPAAGQLLDKAAQATATVLAEAEKTAKIAEEKAAGLAGAVNKEAEALVEKTAETAGLADKKLEEKLSPPSAAPIESSSDRAGETVVLDNKNGKVVLSHRLHAEANGCSACHGAGKPGPMQLGKETAHALCIGCHKIKQAGPGKCAECHQKKGKALEGC